MQIKRYKKDFAYSYALGASPTIELLERRPGDCFRVICSPDYSEQAKLEGLCAGIALEQNRRLINMLSPKENCYVIGAFFKRGYKLEHGAPHVLLDNAGDMGNLGAIMRSCAGFGVNNIALIGGADAYNPKAVRASMGAFFHVNLEYFAGIKDYIAAHGKGRELYAFMLGAERRLTDITPGGPYTLIFGNEASGLERGRYEGIAAGVSIAHTGAVDSLSLPVAASIALFWFNK